MARSAAPYGFRPVRSLSSGGYASGITRPYTMTASYGTSIFYGDLVTVVQAGTLEKYTVTTAGNPVGVFLGCEYTDPTLNYKLHSNMWLASTAATATAMVVDDPHMIFQVQASTTIPQTSMFLNIDVVQTAGNTAIGMSKVALDGANVSDSVTTKTCRIIGFATGPDSAVGDEYTDCLVILNPNDHRMITAAGV